MPTVVSTTRSTTSASAMARSAWRLTCASMPSWVAIQPPVSTTRKSRPFQSASRILRSRVTPGCSSTMASRRPTMRLTRVDLPTLGRPTTATSGSGISESECVAQRDAIGRDDLGVARKVGRCRPVEKGALREADVRKQVAVVGRLVLEGPRDVLADEQPGDADVAAEELVADREHADVVPTELVEQWPQHLRPV